MKVKNSVRTGAGVLHSVYRPRGTKTSEESNHYLIELRLFQKLENEPDNIECYQQDNEVETPDGVDKVESPDVNSTSQEEESYETTATRTVVNEGEPPISKKRKAALVEKTNE
ncbi:hypothetical protein AVEN_233390-1 [Araneus ventricosus]|uniref:Uncharacterized protein n=1 Tax=Araneus ventricosus TaxID=182803 RepID=A0A4Y2ML54_ARAVE|nr:hypothetical protein AVEN_233390-1 [Araneus ventricosus]